MSEVTLREAPPHHWMWLRCSCGKSFEQKLWGKGEDLHLGMMEMLLGFLRDHMDCPEPVEGEA